MVHAIIRRNALLRPLFGLKRMSARACLTPRATGRVVDGGYTAGH
jgi:hypothetical protein